MYPTTTTESNNSTTAIKMSDFKIDYSSHPDCVLCGEKCECRWGNNPYPLAVKGVCCGRCNFKVIMARLEGLNNPQPYEFSEDDESEDEEFCDDSGVMEFIRQERRKREAEDEETCDKCGKKESECDIYEQGDNITNFATTGQMLCPDCIPCSDDEDEDEGKGKEETFDEMITRVQNEIKNGTWKPKWNCENGDCPNEFNLKDDDRHGEETLWCPECVSKFGEPRDICGRRLPDEKVCDEKVCDGQEYCKDCLEEELGMN